MKKVKALLDEIVEVVSEQVLPHTPSNAPEWLKNYNKNRSYKHSKYLCHAPYNSMYFNVYGEVAPCWLTLEKIDSYPQKSIREIWFGEKFSSLRAAMKGTEFHEKCATCRQNLEQGNYVSVLSKLYDYQYKKLEYPTVMEFELSNRCNLECVMCKGELSSTIRQNRDLLPPLEMVYDDAFIDQLEEFIPHLKEAKFLGGEPFLIDIYFKIWEKMALINPGIKITITTNGSVYNQKVKRVLDSLDCNIIFSIDSIYKSTYENIRINGNLERVLANFEHFRTYTSQRKNFMGISVNPLRKNWKELADYVKFCNEKEVSIWFNTVVYPFSEALWTLSANELQEIYEVLSAKTKEIPTGKNHNIGQQNIDHYINLVEVQIKNWHADALKFQSEKIQKSITTTDFKPLILEESREYILKDAYLSMPVKEEKIRWIEEHIEQISDKDQERSKALYLLTPEERIAYWKKQERLKA